MPRLKDEIRGSGFSIIELLLVCAVFAILAQILLPLFSQARRIAYRTQCASNLRQFAGAFMAYTQDWSDYWPCPGGLRGDHTYWAQTGNGGLQSYLPQRGVKSVWCCPMLDGWNGKYSPRSYSMNSYLRTPADAEYPACCAYRCGIRSGLIPRSAKTILLYEGCNIANDEDKDLDYIYRCANWFYVSGYVQKNKLTKELDHPWHGQYNNYLYCDGHVIARKPGRWTISQFSTYSEMYEWYVDKAAYEVRFNTYWSKKVPRDGCVSNLRNFNR
ncbi:MAG: type II secretion system protein [Armatimonadota bacterium]